jgi:hypothetical protein
LNVFLGVESGSLYANRAEALNILVALERIDPERKDFYARRISDFNSSPS